MVALLVSATVAQATIQQYFRSIVSPAKAGKPVSLQVKQQTSLSADEPGYKVAGQPPPQQAQTIRLNKGFKFNGKYFTRCKLASCRPRDRPAARRPPRSGPASAPARRSRSCSKVDAKLTLFNGEKQGGKDTVYVFTLPTIGPSFVVVGTITRSTRATTAGSCDSDRPDQDLPNAPDAAIIQVRTNTPVKSVKVKKGRRSARST